MKCIKIVFYLFFVLVPICFANKNKGITINTVFHSPVAPFFGIAGCQVDVLKIKSDNLSYGLSVNFDLTYDGWFGNIWQIKPEIVYTLKNPHKHSNHLMKGRS